jgi:hypothetical protein
MTNKSVYVRKYERTRYGKKECVVKHTRGLPKR